MFGTEPFIFCILLFALNILARFPCDDDDDHVDHDDHDHDHNHDNDDDDDGPD